MWSGPRNLSTALMYSFGARDDCAIWDEPFYAAYLSRTGLNHPMREEVIASQETDPNKISAACGGAIPSKKNVWYQKHMCQHMVEGFDLNFISKCHNVFLIRHPARVIASYHAKHDKLSLSDIGFLEQIAIFEQVSQSTGKTPIVIDSSDIRENPKQSIENLCNALGLEFQERMLGWPKGGNENDGIWAKHWYQAVWNSTGFARKEVPVPKLCDEHEPILTAALPIYEKLSEYKI